MRNSKENRSKMYRMQIKCGTYSPDITVIILQISLTVTISQVNVLSRCQHNPLVVLIIGGDLRVRF